MRKLITLLICFLLVVPVLSSCSTSYDAVLNVYNWGEYMSLGEEGSLNVNKAFEEWYLQEYGVKVKVNYDTFDSNESLRSKLDSNAISYDVIIPSDYMIEYFINKDMLLELDFNNIPNYSTNIPDDFKNLYFDPDNKYTVPYAYGMVGVIYDANIVDEADTGSWDLLWNEKYKDQILQFNNSRDAFGTAMYKNKISVNTTDKSEWDKAYDELCLQKPIIKGNVMDEIFNDMEIGEAAIGCYYAGDYFTMADEQTDGIDLQFYYPRIDGEIYTNLYVDSFCIPKCCKNKELAERYINFMLSEEPAIANAETTYYATPNKVVYENETYKEDIAEAYDVLYPSDFDFANNYDKFAYRNLDSETLAYITQLWEQYLID